MKAKFHALHYSLYIALLVVPTLSGCGSDEYPDYTRQAPKRSDIVGLWVLTAESVQDMKTRGRYKSSNTTLLIKNDGTFDVTDLPDCAHNPNNTEWSFGKHTLLTATGIWEIHEEKFNPFFDSSQKEITVWNLSLGFPNPKLGAIPPAPYPVLLSQNPPYMIHVPFGDQDGSDHIDFVKR